MEVEEEEVIVYKANPGPQEMFVACTADIAIYGGSAGGGKTFGILFDMLRHREDKDFYGVVFRRTESDVKKPGSCWDEAGDLYTVFGGEAKQKALEYHFTHRDDKNIKHKGMKIKFSHMEYEKDTKSWQSAQLTGVYFDEATHFKESQILYMVSRLRSKSKVKPYMRLTCNPDPDSFIRRWIDWWIGEDGFPIRERSGIVRYFVIRNDEMIWGDTRQEIVDQTGDPEDADDARSFTFIASSLEDNTAFFERDPEAARAYRAGIKSMGRVEAAKLLGGNWDVAPDGGSFYDRKWTKKILKTQVPRRLKLLRYWDRAATKPNELNKDPDWTVGTLLGEDEDKNIYVLDVERFREGPGKVKEKIKKRAKKDPRGTRIVLEQDPGAAGKSEVATLVKYLNKYNVRTRNACGMKDKLTRFEPFSAFAENAYDLSEIKVFVVAAAWNETFHRELERFCGDGSGKDDQVDTISGGYNEFVNKWQHSRAVAVSGVSQPNNAKIV